MNKITFVDLAVFLPSSKTLIVGDIHIGYEEALNKHGVMVPRIQFEETIKRFESILRKTQPDTIVINGDLKHEFGTISDQEWRETLQLLSFFSKHTQRLILVKGNHDTILGPIAQKKDLEVVDYFVTERIMITHGHKIHPCDEEYDTIIIGHEHPAIGLHSGSRVEMYRCFLVGEYEKKQLIVMPSCNLITEGNNILKEARRLSPFLSDLNDFEVFVPDNSKVTFFGTVSELIASQEQN